jgi:hypothetical protein
MHLIYVCMVPFKKVHHDKLLKNKVVCPLECPETGAQWASTHTGTFHFINHTASSMIYKI